MTAPEAPKSVLEQLEELEPELDGDSLKSVLAQARRVDLEGYGSRRTIRERFSKAARKFLKRVDEDAERKGWTTEAMLIIVQVDPETEAREIKGAHLLRSIAGDQAAIGLLQAATAVVQRHMADPTSVPRR